MKGKKIISIARGYPLHQARDLTRAQMLDAEGLCRIKGKYGAHSDEYLGVAHILANYNIDAGRAEAVFTEYLKPLMGPKTHVRELSDNERYVIDRLLRGIEQRTLEKKVGGK
ncbi:hypothetical protein HZB00_01760 [Candidatus Woesearchaeota archaeon]|nr:hypothetical protein [Candidatus Woesearchaeota archaeon]